MTYVIQLNDPNQLRKDLLTAAKYSVTSMKSKHRLAEIRDLKAKKLRELGELVIDIDTGFEELKEALPAHSPEDMPKLPQKPEPKKKEKATKKAAKKQPKPEPEQEPEVTRDAMEELEAKLDAIESKLNKL